jgi:hypothetical protein
MLFQRAALPLSRKTLTLVAQISSAATFAELTARFGVGTTTAWRYVEATVALLAARPRGCAPRSGTRRRPGAPTSWWTGR